MCCHVLERAFPPRRTLAQVTRNLRSIWDTKLCSPGALGGLNLGSKRLSEALVNYAAGFWVQNAAFSHPRKEEHLKRLGVTDEVPLLPLICDS